MPLALLPILGRVLAYVLGSLVGKIIFGLGVGYVEYKGVELVISQTHSYINSLTSGFPPEILEAWTVFGFPTALNMIFAAYSTRITIMGVRKITFTGPSS